MTEQVGIVGLFPNQDEVRSRHVHRDERAASGRAWKRIGRHAEPPRVVRARIIDPKVLVDLDVDILDEDRAGAGLFESVDQESAQA